MNQPYREGEPPSLPFEIDDKVILSNSVAVIERADDPEKIVRTLVTWFGVDCAGVNIVGRGDGEDDGDD